MAFEGGGVRPVTVPLTSQPNSVDVITAPCRLVGWSLEGADSSGVQGTGTQVAPGAGTTIASAVAFTAGERTINWTVGLSGAAAAAELNNFGLFVGATQVATSNNLPAAGEYPQPPVQVVLPAGGATIAIKAIGAGTAGVTYDAILTLDRLESAECQITDGAQVVGLASPAPGTPSNFVISDAGMYVGTKLAVTVLTGSISGVLYIRDFDDNAAL